MKWGEFFKFAGVSGLDPISMGRMTLWQVMMYRDGCKAKTPKSEEEKATEEIADMADDDFFALMNEEIIEGEEISQDDFIKTIKKGGI